MNVTFDHGVLTASRGGLVRMMEWMYARTSLQHGWTRTA
jgi:hypothetical protein